MPTPSEDHPLLPEGDYVPPGERAAAREKLRAHLDAWQADDEKSRRYQPPPVVNLHDRALELKRQAFADRQPPASDADAAVLHAASAEDRRAAAVEAQARREFEARRAGGQQIDRRTGELAPPPEEADDQGPDLSVADVVRFCEVEPREVKWLWKPWLPAGKLVMLDGDPGQGKSFVTLDLIARLSQGREMPDGQPNPAGGPARSLVVACEDGTEDTTVPRLIGLGADLRWVDGLPGVGRGGRVVRPIQLPRDIPALEDIVRDGGTRLVVVDPVMAFLAASVNTVSDQSVRLVLGHLTQVAENTGCTFLFVRHLNKTGGRPAIYRGGGSIGLIAAMRAGWLIGRDPNDRDRRVLTMVKCNLGREPKSLAFRLTQEPPEPMATVVTWEGEVDLTANDLVNDVKRAVDAVGWLKRALAGGPRPAKELKGAADEAGIGERALDAAKVRLAVRSLKRGGERHGAWYWALPDATHEPGGGLEPLEYQLAPVERLPGDDDDDGASPAGRCRDWLAGLLAGRSLAAGEVARLGADAGFRGGVLKEARGALGVVVEKAAAAAGGAVWRLPGGDD